MSLTTLAAAAVNTAFQARCKAALWSPAQNILNEASDTANHGARADWARRVFAGELNLTGEQLVVQVLRNGTIAGLSDPTTATDNDIQFQVGAVLADLIAIG